MSVVAVIPARYAATRFPGKPLANKTGKFMIQHVHERVRQSKLIDRIIVATDDERIAQAVKSFDGQVHMTRSDHVSGTDRVGEVAHALKLADDDIVLNVQGDEPEIEPASLDALIERMQNGESRMVNGGLAHPNPERKRRAEQNRSSKFQNRAREEAENEPSGPASEFSNRASEEAEWVSIGTIAAPFDDSGPKEGPGSPFDPNCVKVVLDAAGNALYFSRSPIPYPRDTGGVVDRPARWLLHMGVYAFRADTLRRISRGDLEPAALERAESLEQLRWLHAGYKIAVVVVKDRSVGIDTPQDYEAFVQRWRTRNEKC